MRHAHPTMTFLKSFREVIKKRPLVHLLALSALITPLVLAAPPAQAGRSDIGNRSVDRGLSRSSSRNWTHSVQRSTRHRFTERSHVSASAGYYKQIYRPAVYRTTYDDYGRSLRICIKAARYERVWVSTASSRHRSHW